MDTGKDTYPPEQRCRQGVHFERVVAGGIDDPETGPEPNREIRRRQSDGEAGAYCDHFIPDQVITADSSPWCTSIVPLGRKPILR